MGEVRLVADENGRMDFWTPSTDENQTIPQAKKDKVLPRQCKLGSIIMNMEAIWEMSDEW